MIPPNAPDYSKYIGIPYSEHGQRPGLNCWELCERIMIEVFGITPPQYEYAGDYAKVNSCFVAALERWQKVSKEDRQPGDLVLMNIIGLPIHLGILVERNLMIHTMSGISSTCEFITRPVWSKRIEGFYRWKELTNSFCVMDG